jgi:hypothetical protein
VVVFRPSGPSRSGSRFLPVTLYCHPAVPLKVPCYVQAGDPAGSSVSTDHTSSSLAPPGEATNRRHQCEGRRSRNALGRRSAATPPRSSRATPRGSTPKPALREPHIAPSSEATSCNIESTKWRKHEHRPNDLFLSGSYSLVGLAKGAGSSFLPSQSRLGKTPQWEMRYLRDAPRCSYLTPSLVTCNIETSGGKKSLATRLTRLTG